MSIPEKIFVNVYAPFAGQSGTAYATRELADQMAARGRLACIEIDLANINTAGALVGRPIFIAGSEAAK